LLEGLTDLAARRGVALDEAGFAASRGMMAVQLKALAAQRLFGTGAYFRVINPALSSAYRRAVEIVQDWNQEGKPLLKPKK